MSWCEEDNDAILQTVEPLSVLFHRLPESLQARLVRSARRQRSLSDQNQAEFAGMHQAFEGVEGGDHSDQSCPAMEDIVASLPKTLQRRLVTSARRSRQEATASSPKPRGGRAPLLTFDDALGVNAVAVAICDAAASLEQRGKLVRRYVCEYHSLHHS